MLDEQNGDLELIPDPADVLHELLGLPGVHAGRGLVKQEQGRIGGQGTHNLQAALGAVGQAARAHIRQVLHVKDRQKFQGFLVLSSLLGPVSRQTQDAGEHVIADLIVQADAHILFHRHVAEQADILECPCHAQLAGLHNVQALGIVPVDEHGAAGGLIHLGQQIEHGGLAGAVGTDQAGDLRTPDGEVEIIHGLEAAELDAQVMGFQHRLLAHVPLRHDGVAGNRNHLGFGSVFLCRHGHAFCPPSTLPSLRNLATSRLAMLLRMGLLVASITRISTTA